MKDTQKTPADNKYRRSTYFNQSPISFTPNSLAVHCIPSALILVWAAAWCLQKERVTTLTKMWLAQGLQEASWRGPMAGWQPPFSTSHVHISNIHTWSHVDVKTYTRVITCFFLSRPTPKSHEAPRKKNRRNKGAESLQLIFCSFSLALSPVSPLILLFSYYFKRLHQLLFPISTEKFASTRPNSPISCPPFWFGLAFSLKCTAFSEQWQQDFLLPVHRKAYNHVSCLQRVLLLFSYIQPTLMCTNMCEQTHRQTLTHTQSTFFCFLCQLFFWKIYIKSDYQRALDVIVVKVRKPFPFFP